MKHRVKIKTVEQLEKMYGVTFHHIPEDKSAPCGEWWATYETLIENSFDTFTEEFDSMLPDDRIVDIYEDGESYICEIEGSYQRVSDWFIDDNLNV